VGGSLSRDAIRYQYMREGTLMEYFYILNFIRFFVMLVSETEIEVLARIYEFCFPLSASILYVTWLERIINELLYSLLVTFQAIKD